jgi:hypothetical protein
VLDDTGPYFTVQRFSGHGGTPLAEVGLHCGIDYEHVSQFAAYRKNLLKSCSFLEGLSSPCRLHRRAPLRECQDGAIIRPDTRRRRMAFGETDPSEQRGGAATSPAGVPGKVTFSRRELNRILGLYGRMVAAGEWRDYAIDFLKDRAVFSVFRRASEVPLYRIEKNPQLARKQGAYSVISATGLIVKRGHELDNVLRAVDKSLRLVAT